MSVLLMALLTAEPFTVTGYLPSYRMDSWDASNAGPLTDVVYFQVTPRPDGTLPPEPFAAEMMTKLAAIRAGGLRVSLCIGGWGKSETFRSVVGSAAHRRALIDALRRLPFDGYDLDWEYPETAADWAGLNALLRELRLAAPNRLITLAVAGSRPPPAATLPLIDRLHVMSYDHAFPHATPWKTTADIDRMLAAGCPPGKLILGLPFYGRARDRNATAYRDLPVGPVDLDVSETGVAFNGPATIELKVRDARRRGLGGVMIWELGQDRTDSRSLLRAIGRELASETD